MSFVFNLPDNVLEESFGEEDLVEVGDVGYGRVDEDGALLGAAACWEVVNPGCLVC